MARRRTKTRAPSSNDGHATTKEKTTILDVERIPRDEEEAMLSLGHGQDPPEEPPDEDDDDEDDDEEDEPSEMESLENAIDDLIDELKKSRATTAAATGSRQSLKRSIDQLTQKLGELTGLGAIKNLFKS